MTKTFKVFSMTYVMCSMQIHFFLYIHKMLLLVAKENKNVC